MDTTLTTRRLGTTDMTITTVGFGAWAIGGGDWAFGWGRRDEQSIATIRHARARGVNWIDTAAVYGLGHSEEVVRRALEGIPRAERPYVFTKCGMVWDQRDRMAAPRQDLRPDSIRRECEASLRRLGVERIDLYQFHWPDETGTPVEHSWAEMVRLVEEGKVRAVGVSNFDVDLLGRCERIRHVDSLQPPFSLIRRRLRAKRPLVGGTRDRRNCLQPAAVGFSPSGSTPSGSPARAGRLAPQSPEFKPPKLGRNIALRDTPSHRPAPSHHRLRRGDQVDPGPARCHRRDRRCADPEQVDGWLDAASLELDSRDLDEIAWRWRRAALRRPGTAG
jgi:hypothetical protein